MLINFERQGHFFLTHHPPPATFFWGREIPASNSYPPPTTQHTPSWFYVETVLRGGEKSCLAGKCITWKSVWKMRYLLKGLKNKAPKLVIWRQIDNDERLSCFVYFNENHIISIYHTYVNPSKKIFSLGENDATCLKTLKWGFGAGD